jgi:transcription-repair coupling factor (superfamily II helicase)
MLGGEQSGHIEAVGFEMYTSMLQFTPQGLLKYPLKATRPDDVLLEIREVLAMLAPTPVSA